METRVRKLLGTIIAVSAIGIMITNYITNGNMDSYILPFILLWFSVVIFLNKPKKEKKLKEMSKKQRYVILSAVSVALITGVAAFITTLF